MIADYTGNPHKSLQILLRLTLPILICVFLVVKIEQRRWRGKLSFCIHFCFLMYFSAIHPFDECVSLNVCQLSVVRGPVPLPFQPGPTARSSPDLRFGPDCPLPLLSTNPCCSISHLPLPPFHRLNLPQPLQYPFLAGLPCTGACSNVQLHRKPLFTNKLPQVKPAVTRSFFFFLQIFWPTNPKLWKSKEGCHKMFRWLHRDRRKDCLNIAGYTLYIS